MRSVILVAGRVYKHSKQKTESRSNRWQKRLRGYLQRNITSSANLMRFGSLFERKSGREHRGWKDKVANAGEEERQRREHQNLQCELVARDPTGATRRSHARDLAAHHFVQCALERRKAEPLVRVLYSLRAQSLAQSRQFAAPALRLRLRLLRTGTLSRAAEAVRLHVGGRDASRGGATLVAQ